MSIYQERAKECKCCGKHVPLPTVLKEYNGVPLCPTTFSNVMEYKRIWNKSRDCQGTCSRTMAVTC